MWITESYTIRQLSKISGHSQFKLKQIKNYWLSKEPPALLNINYQKIKYIIFDGTYFHKDGCLIVFIDSTTKRPFYYAYVNKESYENVYPATCYLKSLGLNPKAFTLDGHPHVIKALIATWSSVLIQRCLFHIQNQGLMWIRKPPKTQAGKDLSVILKSCTSIKTQEESARFVKSFYHWNTKYNNEIELLDKTSIAYKDLKRTRSLINNALKDMFHFVKDQNIVSTTNYLESFFKHLKHNYRCHNGLSLKHKIAYLKWYCFYKNYTN